MLSVKQLAQSIALKEGLNYVKKNPMENFPKLLKWGKKFASRKDHRMQIDNIAKKVKDPTTTTYKFIERILTELNPEARKKFLVNFFLNSGIVGMPESAKIQEKEKCNIPWAILLDPTAACNLKCIGCWAAEYNKGDSLSYETIDRIIMEGKDLGIYMYIFSGGEPLVRKEDILKIIKKHSDCMFLSFTNATLIDEKFADEVAKSGNLTFAISVEGFEKETDMRRGANTYQRVIVAMDILKDRGIGFGFSSCYTSKNYLSIGSEEYMDFMIKKGCLFGWLFTYMPLGKNAVPDLMVSPDQRKFMYDRVRAYRKEKPLFLMDFWNDGEYVGGCIAGGRRYLHINANGDVEPCAFIHYANVNINDTSLLEALKSPIFQQFNKNQPFNDNQLRPCPLLDNPEKLREMVHASNSHSTQPEDEENVDDLTAKCEEKSDKWAVMADELWSKSH